MTRRAVHDDVGSGDGRGVVADFHTERRWQLDRRRRMGRRHETEEEDRGENAFPPLPAARTPAGCTHGLSILGRTP